jgi:hypothetical protein
VLKADLSLTCEVHESNHLHESPNPCSPNLTRPTLETEPLGGPGSTGWQISLAASGCEVHGGERRRGIDGCYRVMPAATLH